MIAKLDKENDMKMFVSPWTYDIKPLPTESEEGVMLREKEKGTENLNKFEEFEKKMETKHSELVTSLEKWSHSILNIVKPGSGGSFSSLFSAPQVSSQGE